MYYYLSVIVDFRDAGTELLWKTGKSRRIPANLRISAWKKMAILNAAVHLDNLKIPPGNRLEALKKDRKASTAFASMINTGSALSGTMATRMR
jgi:plasmid maintenance system killer protein